MNKDKMKKWEDTYRSKLDCSADVLTQTGDSTLVQTENSLKQDEKRFNQSFALILENFRVPANETIHE